MGVSVFVGRKAFQNFLLPCMETAVFDVEEFVIQRAMHALAALCQLGLFEKKAMLETLAKLLPLLAHPSTWIRNEAISFVVAAADRLGLAKAYCLVVPPLKPFLRYELIQITRDSLIHCLKPPVTRREFQAALQPNAPKADAAAGKGAAAAAASASASAPPPPPPPPPLLVSTPSTQNVSASMGVSGSNPPPRLGQPQAVEAVPAPPPVPSVEESERLVAARMTEAGAAAADSSGLMQDPELLAQMSKYITRLALAIQVPLPPPTPLPRLPCSLPCV